MIILAEVLTNVEDDKFGRVKVKSPKVWEESELMPSLNSIYLDKGDQVLVNIDEGVDNAYIVSKVRSKKQVAKSQKGKGHIIYESSKEGKWATLWASEGNLYWKNSDGVEVQIEGTKVSIKSKDINFNADNVKVEAKNAEIKATNIKFDGAMEETANALPANGKGAFCGLPACLFSGSPHTVDKAK